MADKKVLDLDLNLRVRGLEALDHERHHGAAEAAVLAGAGNLVRKWH